MGLQTMQVQVSIVAEDKKKICLLWKKKKKIFRLYKKKIFF